MTSTSSLVRQILNRPMYPQRSFARFLTWRRLRPGQRRSKFNYYHAGLQFSNFSRHSGIVRFMHSMHNIRCIARDKLMARTHRKVITLMGTRVIADKLEKRKFIDFWFEQWHCRDVIANSWRRWVVRQVACVILKSFLKSILNDRRR